jgi:hypothetical protein
MNTTSSGHIIQFFNMIGFKIIGHVNITIFVIKKKGRPLIFLFFLLQPSNINWNDFIIIIQTHPISLIISTRVEDLTSGH